MVKIQDLIADIFRNYIKEIQFTDGLIRRNKTGHTPEMSSLDFCHDGRMTSAYYALHMASGSLGEERGQNILKAIQILQINDVLDSYYGSFRWYREETKVNDTNAAFFIMMPLVVVRLFYTENIPSSHISLIDDMLIKGADWFLRECEHPTLYYSNKVISDGAMLLSISNLSKHQGNYQMASKLFEKWCKYTAQRGWGWGENISLTYLGVILNSLQLACQALHPRDEQLKRKLNHIINNIIETLQFHEGFEFVPTIRSYNFSGNIQRKSLLWVVAGIHKNILDELKLESEQSLWNLITLLIFKDKINETYRNSTEKKESDKQSIPRVRKEKVFEDTYAYTWIGRKGRVGSLNKFPVIPGCYQHSSWGLGWQSYPVTFAVNNHQISYLRWAVKVGNEVRTHPAKSKKSYLSPALFNEDYYPDVKTYCSQNRNALLVVRSMSGVHNQASEILDEWFINKFSGGLSTYSSERSNRIWVIVKYDKSAVALSALKAIKYQEKERRNMKITVEQGDKSVCLKQFLYQGGEEVLHHPRLEVGWALIFFDQGKELSNVEKQLDFVKIKDEVIFDLELPRMPYTEARKIEMSDNRTIDVNLSIDPYKQYY